MIKQKIEKNFLEMLANNKTVNKTNVHENVFGKIYYQELVTTFIWNSIRNIGNL